MTTQAQVTGPVDDAIDADVSALCIAFGRYIVGLPGGNADRSAVREIEERLTARLAPRADALIEREQVNAAVIAGHMAYVDGPRVEPGMPHRGINEFITDSVMALLPRAPMPDVVTMRERAAKWIAIQDGIRWDYLTDDMKADWFPLADELLAALFDAEVGS